MARWHFLLLVGLLAAPLQAGEPRVDALGDSLPQGAIARLGSTRFRTAGWSRNLAFTHDDRALVACLNDAVVVWDRPSGKELRRFAIPDPYSTALSADAKFLALLDEKRIRIFETSSGKEKRSWPRPANPGHTVRMVFSHDGKTLAVSADDQVVLYDWAAAQKLVVLSEAKGANGLALSPDGRWLAITAYQRPLEIWDAATGKRVRQVKTREAPYPSFPAFSPDSARIAWYESGRIKTVAVGTGELGSEFESNGGERSLLFTADSKQVVSGAQGRGVQLWDLASKAKKCDISTEHFRFPVLALSHDGKTLAIGDSNGDHQLIRLYDLAKNREFPDEPGHPLSINALAFSADGKTLASADRARFLFWDARTGERRRELPVEYNHRPVFSPDLKRAARLFILDIRCTELDASKKETGWKYDGKEMPTWAAFTHDAKLLITTRTRTYYGREGDTEPLGKDGLLVWDISSGKVVRSLDAGRDSFFVGLRVTPDGRIAVAPTAEGKITHHYILDRISHSETNTNYEKGGPIHVWDLKAGHLLQTLEGHKGAAPNIAVSADGRFLASSGYDRQVRLWELASGKTIFIFSLGESQGQPVAMSADGRLIAAARDPKGERPHICIWAAATGKELHRFQGYPAKVDCLAMSPDGTRLASALSDGTVLLWDLGPVQQAAERKTAKLPPGAAASLWKDLGSLDAAQAHRATWTLIGAPEETVVLFRKELQPAKVDPAHLQKLLADLDSNQFTVREASIKGLIQLGELADAPLRKLLAGGASLEASRRIEPLLDYSVLFVQPATLARRRAIFVLERIATLEARALLRTMAQGSTQARSTQEAQGQRELWANKAVWEDR